ncbi:MAG: hypothetical protein HY099_00935 [Nitrospirae bacterium]|nr:hypothetical protein [Nitrospirota bacterium]
MKRLLILMLIMFVFIASCGKKEVKKVSEDSKIATESFGVIEAIKEAYVKKDVLAIEKNATKEGFRAISGVVKSFDSAELTFSPVLVEIEDGAVHLNVSWKGIWKREGKTTEERGMAIFALKGRPLKVDNILRANPFRYPE